LCRGHVILGAKISGDFKGERKIRKKIIFALSLSIITANSFCFSIPFSKSGNQDYKQLFAKYYHVRKLEAAQNYEDALTECRELIENHAGFFNVYGLFARISRESNTLDGSIDYLQKQIQREPKRTEYYYGLGLCYKEQKEFEKASDIYKSAIEKGADFLVVFYELLVIAQTKEECKDLIDYFEVQSKLHPNNSYFFYGIAAIYQYKLGQFDLALENFQKAVDIARASGSKLEEGQHLNMIGNHYWSRSKFSKASEYFTKAVEAIKETEVKTQWISYLYNSGLMYCYLSQPLKGREYYRQALEVAREIGHKEEEAKLLRSIGFTHVQMSEYTQALDFYRETLDIAQEIADRRRQAECLTDIADIDWKKGNYSQSIEKYEESLRISRDVGDDSREFWTLVGMGNVFLRTGDFSKSLQTYLQALEINKLLKLRHQEGILLINIANIYLNTGDHSKALDYYQQALDIHKETGSMSSEGVTLNNIARVYSEQKDYSRAAEVYRQAIQIARETGDKRAEANRLNNLANTYTHLGDFATARTLYDEALTLTDHLGTKEIEANVYRDRAYMFDRVQEYSRAQESFLKAISISKEIGYSQKIWLAHAGLASVYNKQNKDQEALEQYTKALENIESMRSQIRLEEHKSGFLSDKIEVYVSLVSLLFDLHQGQPPRGFAEEAYYVAEKAKARAFLDSLREGKTNLSNKLSADLKEEENELLRRISGIQTELVKPRISDAKRQELYKELEEAEDDHLNLVQRIRNASPIYAQIVYPEPHRLEDIKKRLLDAETAILEYLVGEEEAFLFFVTKDDFSVHRLSASKDLGERANDYLSLLKTRTDRDFQAFSAGERLFQELIGPVKEKLVSIKKLIIIPDGNLSFLPFEALVGPGRDDHPEYLISDYRISYAPSATALANLLDRKNLIGLQKDLLAFADPDYDFAEISRKEIDADYILREVYLEQGFEFSPLRYSAEEVRQISKLIKKKARDVYTEKDAKEEKIKSLTLKDYKIMHFATHGFFDEKVPLRSSLLLTLDQDPTEDGFFQAREIYRTDLSAKLVVLSACQTGRGKLERGEGVMGLSRAFLYAGAESVVASLWSINDKATSVFMKHFYEGLSQGMSKEQSLQKAKLDMIGSRYKHPFYWAPFVLNGDSQGVIKLEKPSFWERIF
jgi:CHAT domain-containing protein/tetratricopeptide (TPR) repeat protein